MSQQLIQRRGVNPADVAAAQEGRPAAGGYAQVPQRLGEQMSQALSEPGRSVEWWILIIVIVIAAAAIATGAMVLAFGFKGGDRLDTIDRHCKDDNATCDMELLNAVIAEQQRKECTPAGTLEEDTGCSYSSTKVLQVKDATFSYWARHITPAVMLYNTGFDWTRFESGAQEMRYADTVPKKVSYPALADGKQLLQKMDQAAAMPQTTDLERAKIKLARQEVNFTVSLYDLNFPHSEYDTWNTHPLYDDLLVLSVLTFFSSELDYDTKALLWMQRQQAAREELAQFYADILVKDVLPQVETEFSCATWGGLVGFMATPDLHDPVCDVMSDAALQAQCYAVADDIDAASIDVATIYLDDYCDAAAFYRPMTKPGLGNVHFGNETYEVWLRYMSGLDMSIDDRYAQAQAAIAEGKADVTTLLTSTHGISYNQWLIELADLENPRFTSCYDTLEEVTQHFERADNNVSRAITGIFQYHSRSPYKVEYTGNCCTYSSGNYDPYTNLWLTAGRFGYGEKGFNLAGQFCVDRFSHSVTAHEGRTGHHLQIPLHLQVKCNIDDLWTFFTGYHEGWAAYSELQLNQTTLVNDPNERIYNLYWTTLGTGSVLAADIELNSLGATFADCEATNTDGGGGPFAQPFCLRSAVTPGQLSAYLQGSRVIVAERQRAEAELGGDFDAGTFHMLVTKFGDIPWDELHLLVSAWIQWVQDRDAALLLPWGTTVDRVLFKSADPVVGTGFTIPNTGAVLINSVQSVVAAAIAENATLATWKNQTGALHAVINRNAAPGIVPAFAPVA